MRAAAPIAPRAQLLSRVRVARPALDAEALRQGVALIALCTFVGLALGLVLVVASRSTQLSPILEKGGSPRWLAWPFHEIAPEVRHPIFNRTVRELKNALPAGQMVRPVSGVGPRASDVRPKTGPRLRTADTEPKTL